MTAEKFSDDPEIRRLLVIEADRENRSLTNMPETLVFAHRTQNELQPPAVKGRQTKEAGK